MEQRIATAQWADLALVEEKYLYRDGDVWLGRSASDRQVPLGYCDDRHVCLVSGSRGGKGATSIVNNLILWPGSICVVDPKGENATITASRRGNGSSHCKGLGQAVQVLDPFSAAQVDDSLRGRFNPLDALDPANDETIDEAGRLADAIVVVRETSNDPFWDESARSMIKGLLLHVLTAPEYEGRRNLITVRNLILRGDWEAVEALRNAGETDIPPAHGLLWTGLSNNPAFGGLIAGIGDSFTNMLLNSPKQYESVLQVANRNTEFIDSPAMQRCFEASDFRLSELKTRPEGLSLYLCLPQRYMNTHYRWLRMVIALIVTEMEKVRGRPATGHPVLMVLDEFAGLKRMQVIENAVAQIAGYGVKLFFVLQSLEQIKAVYKDNWETFLANSGLKVFFNLEDHFSREYVSKLIGETEVMREVRSSSESVSESQSVSHSTSRSQSESHGTSVTDGTNSSESTGRSWGINSSSSVSQSMSYVQGIIFKKYDDRTGVGSSRSQGQSKGWTTGQSRGVSHSRGTSDTKGTTIGETDSVTRGTSQSSTSGTSETIQKRPLITPDEIGQVFARIDDKSQLGYPGLALVVISGARPLALMRVNYFEDYQFMDLFDPAPDFPFTAPRELCVDGREMGLSLPEFGLKVGAWTVTPGNLAASNDGAASIVTRAGDNAACIRVPRRGRVTAVQANGAADIPPGPLFSLRYYEDGAALIDPFAELRAFCDKVKRLVAADRRKLVDKINSARLTIGICALAAAFFLLAMSAEDSAPVLLVLAFFGFGVLAIWSKVRLHRLRGSLREYGEPAQHAPGAGDGASEAGPVATKHVGLASALVILAGILAVASPIVLTAGLIVRSERDAAIQQAKEKAAEEARREAEHERMMKALLAKKGEPAPPGKAEGITPAPDATKSSDAGTPAPAPAPSPSSTAPSTNADEPPAFNSPVGSGFIHPPPPEPAPQGSAASPNPDESPVGSGFIHPAPEPAPQPQLVQKVAKVCVPEEDLYYGWDNPPPGGKMEAFKNATKQAINNFALHNRIDETTQFRISKAYPDYDPQVTDPSSLVTVFTMPAGANTCGVLTESYTLPVQTKP